MTSNFSFSHNVFHSYICLVRQNTALCGNGLSHKIGPRVTSNYFFSAIRIYFQGSSNLRAKCQSMSFTHLNL